MFSAAGSPTVAENWKSSGWGSSSAEAREKYSVAAVGWASSAEDRGKRFVAAQVAASTARIVGRGMAAEDIAVVVNIAVVADIAVVANIAVVAQGDTAVAWDTAAGRPSQSCLAVDEQAILVSYQSSSVLGRAAEESRPTFVTHCGRMLNAG